MRRKDIDRIVRDDREHVWHPFTWMPGYLAAKPLVITAARGFTSPLPTGEKSIGRELIEMSSTFTGTIGDRACNRRAGAEVLARERVRSDARARGDARAEARRVRARRAQARLLLRRRRDGGRGRAEASISA